MHVRLPLAGALVAALAAPVAASADAPSWSTPLKTCYVSVAPGKTEPVGIEATNFLPYHPVEVYADEVLQTTATTNSRGQLNGSFAAPFIVSGQRWFTVRLADKVDATTISARSKVTALSVTQSPVAAATGSKVRFRGRGFTEPALPVYAHYLFHGKVMQTVLVGKPYGNCGLFSVRRRQFPMARPRTGTWLIQFDQQRDYAPQASPFTQLKVVVKKKIRPRA